MGREQEQDKLRLQTKMIDSSFEPILAWDFDAGIIEWNPGCERLYGFTHAEAVGHVIHELLKTIHPAPIDQFKKRLAAQGEWIGELHHTTKDGREVIVESRQQVIDIGGRRIVLETNRDITERKRADELLRESETRFRILANSAPVPIWVNRADAGCEFVNEAYLSFFGKSLAELQGFGWQPHAHPEDEENYVGSYLAAFKAREPFRSQARFRNAKGEYRWLDSVALPRFSASGEFLGYVGASPDITESKRVELNTQFINHLDLAFSQITNPDEIVRLATRRLCEYLGVAGCHIGEVNVSKYLVAARADWQSLSHGAQSLAGEHRFDDFITLEFRAALEAGETGVVNDVTTDPRTCAFVSRYTSLGVGAWISVPVHYEKQWQAMLTAVETQPRNWRPDEAQLMRDVASRLWLAVKRAAAVEALRESEERARRTLAEQMVAGIAECDSAGKFRLVNQRYCDMVGYSKSELSQMLVRDITHPDDWAYNAELYSRLNDTGASFSFEKRYRRKDGAEVWVNTNVAPIRSPQGKIDGSVTVVIDITPRKLAEQELAAAQNQLAADLDAMTRLEKIVAMFIREGDLSAALKEIVLAAIAISGAAKGTLQLVDAGTGKLLIAAQLGFERPFLDLWSSVEESHGACGTALRHRERVIVEDVTLSPIFMDSPALDIMLQAGVRAVQSTPVLDRSGKLIAVFSTHFASPHHLDERTLRLLDLLAAETSSMIERAGAETALRFAYEQAEAATRAKDEFLAVVSHELRSPLVSILGYTQLLRGTTPDPARIRRMVEIIDENGKIQLQLIEDLLDTARIVGGKLKLEVKPLNLVHVITTALDVVRPSAEAKGIELTPRLDPLTGQITGDPDRLRQVIWNLLSNAIKFTPAGGRVEITLKRDDPHVRVTVRDTGKGIEAEFLPHVFERFRQSDMSSARRVGGLGLGLALVRHLVELHGGTVEAASAGGGKGATFTIRLPLRAVYTPPLTEQQQHTRGRFTGSQPLSGVRVLIVDDEENVRELLKLTLEGYGAQAQAVDSLKGAVEQLTRQTSDTNFDVLTCDLGMPDEDGYTLIRKVRTLPLEAGGAIPAIALTAYGGPADRVRALEAGFQMHVAKPVEPDELVVVILSLVKRFDGGRNLLPNSNIGN